jgi:nucleoside-diphosphate-sugar epimerase
MKIGITGASGFVGARLVRFHLERGDSVRALSRKGIERLPRGVAAFQTDLAAPVPGALREFAGGLDVLYHCAGEIRRAELMRPLHVGGTERLIEAAAGAIGRWVQLSSMGAYGELRGGRVDESLPENPQNLYEETKTISDRLVREAARARAFDAVVLRPSAIIGPQMSNQSVYQLLRAIRSGRFFFIGPNDAVRNYVHVHDVVRALFLAGTRPEASGRLYNLSDDCTIEQAAEWACEVFEIPCRFRRLPKWPFDLLVPTLQHLPGFPLTSGRLRALTNRAEIAIDRISSELGYSHSSGTRAAIREMASAIAGEGA